MRSRIDSTRVRDDFDLSALSSRKTSCVILITLTNVKASVSIQLSQLSRRRCRDAGAAVYNQRRPLLVSKKRNEK